MKIHFTVSYQELINNSRKLCPFSREKNQTLFSISSTNKMYQFIFYIKLIFYSNKLILILTNLRLIFFPKFPFPKSFCYFIFCIQILSSIFLLPILKQPKISFQDKSTFFFFSLEQKIHFHSCYLLLPKHALYFSHIWQCFSYYFWKH